MQPPRLNISPRMREIMGYPRFSGPKPRMLLFRSHYWLDAACEQAAAKLGWETRSILMKMEGAAPRETIAELLYALAEFRPDFLLSINLSGMDEQGLFARFFDDLALPHVTWFVDDPRTIMINRDCFGGAHSVALSWEKAYLPWLEARGFGLVAEMPLAADTSIFDAPPATAWHEPPSFVGNSMQAPAEREWAWVRERPLLAAAVDDAFARGVVNREHFALGLEAMFEPGALSGFDEHERRHAEILLFVEATRRVRATWIGGLADLGAVARGDAGWRTVTPHVGGPLDYARELPAFYRTCAVNLNGTSIQMATTVNQRVFDCAAAGGFLLTDAQTGLGELFDVEQECATYASLEECREKLAHYLANPQARMDMAARARKRVLGEHTYGQRLLEIARLLRERFG
jgi:spore maturation protein CgeB